MPNPVSFLDQLLLLCAMVAGIVVIFKLRDRILFLMTGSDRIRLDFNNIVWLVFCRCGNTCNGDWTKYVSWVCCYCCESLRGRNLKQILGQMLGLVPVPVRITNIVVGDLPTYYSGDFYVAIQAGEGPEQVTSVTEESNPKVVQFPDTMIIKIRTSLTQGPVRFCVKRNLAFGPETLCEVYLHPMQLASWWLFGAKPPMRFKMEPMERDTSFIFPPWILLELASEPEWGSPQSFEVRVTEFHSQTSVRSTSAWDFKARYTLLNKHGLTTDEPDEREMGQLDSAERTRAACLGQMAFLAALGLLLFASARYYTFSCYQEYAKITVMQRFSVEFPAMKRQREHILGGCGLAGDHVLNLVADSLARAHQAVEAAMRPPPAGTTTFRGAVNATPQEARCSPAPEDILQVCKTLPFGCPAPGINYNLFGMIAFSLPCAPQTCRMSLALKDFDTLFLKGLGCWLAALVVLKGVFDLWIHHVRSRIFSH